MQRQTAQSTLRLIALLTVFFGKIMSTWNMITLLGVRNAVQEASGHFQFQATGMFTELGLDSVIAWASLLFWGWLLFWASPWLADAIVQDGPTEPASQPAPRPEPRPRHPGSPRIPREA